MQRRGPGWALTPNFYFDCVNWSMGEKGTLSIYILLLITDCMNERGMYSFCCPEARAETRSSKEGRKYVHG